MHPKTVVSLLLCAASAASLAAASQVNFYYDDNCESYASSVTLADNFTPSGGAFGARSAMFISIPSGLGWWSIQTEGGQDTQCPRVWSASEAGQCVAYSTGIFADAGSPGPVQC